MTIETPPKPPPTVPPKPAPVGEATPDPGAVSADPYWAARRNVPPDLVPQHIESPRDENADALLVEMARIDDRIVDALMSTVEKVELFRQRKALYQRIHPGSLPVTVSGGPGRGNRGSGKTVLTFAEHTALLTGKGRSTIDGYVATANGIPDRAWHLLLEYKYTGKLSDLQQLADLNKEPDRQLEVVRFLINRARPAEEAPAYLGRRANPKTAFPRMKDAIDAVRWQKVASTRGACPVSGNHYRLLSGDIKATSTHVRDSSVHAILTDIHWDKDTANELFPFVAGLAKRVIVPGGWCLVMVGHERYGDLVGAFKDQGFRYTWQVAYFHDGAIKPSQHAITKSDWTPILAVQMRGGGSLRRTLPCDWVRTTGKDDLTAHRYGKNVLAFEDLVRWISRPGESIYDPFCGSGTTGVAALNTGRRFLGGDIDAGAIAIAADRLAAVRLWGTRALSSSPIQPLSREGRKVEQHFHRLGDDVGLDDYGPSPTEPADLVDLLEQAAAGTHKPASGYRWPV